MSRGSTTNSWVRELSNKDDWCVCWVDPIGFPWHDGSMFANYFTIENLPSMDSGKYVLFDPKLFGFGILCLSDKPRCAVWWHAVVPNRSHGFWRITQRCPLGDPKTWGPRWAQRQPKMLPVNYKRTTLLPGLVFWRPEASPILVAEWSFIDFRWCQKYSKMMSWSQCVWHWQIQRT